MILTVFLSLSSHGSLWWSPTLAEKQRWCLAPVGFLSDRDSGPVCNRLADVKDPVAAEQQIQGFFA